MTVEVQCPMVRAAPDAKRVATEDNRHAVSVDGEYVRNGLPSQGALYDLRAIVVSPDQSLNTIKALEVRRVVPEGEVAKVKDYISTRDTGAPPLDRYLVHFLSGGE